MNIYDKKYQVFISSTYTDLVEARNEVIKVLLGLHQLPIGMEMFSADNDEQWAVIQETIDKSDYYILIVGQRYGSLTKEDISYTEKEYDYAVSINVPVMIFLQDTQVATTPSERDLEPEKVEKLRTFRAKVAGNRMASFWKTHAELAQQVLTAIIKSFTRHPRIGWVRTDQVASPQVTTELAALSQENRELKKQLEQLLDVQNSRKPSFELFANREKRLQSEFLEHAFEPHELLHQIRSSDDFPAYLRQFYNVHEVNRYNQQLAEHADEVERYNSRVELSNRKISGSTRTTFSIQNTGKAKANEVVVELIFPEELVVMEKLPVGYPEEKLPAAIGVHPIKSATTAFQNINSGSNTYGGGTIQHNSSPQRHNYKIDANRLTLKLDSLLHTRSGAIDEPVFICPLATGTFSIEVSIVCEEFHEIQYCEFLVDVV